MFGHHVPSHVPEIKKEIKNGHWHTELRSQQTGQSSTAQIKNLEFKDQNQRDGVKTEVSRHRSKVTTQDVTKTSKIHTGIKMFKVAQREVRSDTPSNCKNPKSSPKSFKSCPRPRSSPVSGTSQARVCLLLRRRGQGQVLHPDSRTTSPPTSHILQVQSRIREVRLSEGLPKQ